MAYYSDFGALQRAAMKLVEGVLKKDVAPIVEKKLANSAKSRAAGETSRGALGIADPGNMDSTIAHEGDGSLTLCTKDIALPGKSIFDNPKNSYSDSYDPYGTEFSEWIEYGEWMDVEGYLASGGRKKPKRPARPFVEPAQQEINASHADIIAALQANLPH